jgi:hypothetical protein
MNKTPKHNKISSRLRFALASGTKKFTCCYHGCKEPATIDVWKADTYLCDEHYLINTLSLGNLEGVSITNILKDVRKQRKIP